MSSETMQENKPQADEHPTSAIEISVLLPTIEALLVSADKPLQPLKVADPLAALFDTPVTVKMVDEGVDLPNEQYDQSGRAFRIERIAGGYRVMTRSEYAPVIAAMHRA
ncbi:MAG: SMC-Scp complex subunit ScpB, partial [Phycisphaerales bacterium]|nr:SMC-Scp complex subunit ScpB [Phycisphaerales bacterium]